MCSEWELQWQGDHCFWSHGESNARGAAILIKRNTQIQVQKSVIDDRGRYVIIQYEEVGEKFVLVNIYAPNEDDPAFFLQVFKHMEEFDGRRIITGDFNLTMQSELDRTSNNSNNNENAAEIVRKYMEDTLMTDVWRDRNENTRIYTYMRKARGGEERIVGSRIDYFLVDNAIVGWIPNIRIYSKYKTDHSAVLLEIHPFEIKRGRGYWKLNNRILYESEYIEKIKMNITEMKERNNISQNSQEMWEALKIKMIATSQEYSKDRAQNRKLVIEQLEQKVMEYESKHVNDLALAELKLYHRTQQDLEAFKDEHIQSVIFRSKV